MNASINFDTDILIIGAGPVGLTLAVALVKQQVRFRIIDLKAAPEKHSKAANLWPRTQEVFASLGILDLLAGQASPLHAVSLHAYGKALGHVRMDDNQSPYPVPLFVGQNVIETELSAFLLRTGVEIERNTKALVLYNESDSVTVEVEGPIIKSSIRCKYVVGCDGPSGFTRQQVGLSFEPKQLQARILRQVDARVRWSRPVQIGIADFFLADNQYLGYLPLPGGHDRFFVVTPDDGVPDRAPTLEEMQAAVRSVTGDQSVELYDPIWLTRGRLNHGVARSFQAGRVFLAGDAGHMTIPVYGQGMNTGMQDAFNLAWKLQTSLNNPVAGLLETYSQERHAVRSALDKEQGVILQRAAFPTAIQKIVLPLIAPIALAHGAGRHFRDRSAQLMISYPESTLSLRYNKHSGLGAGDRAPDAFVVRKNDLQTISLFSMLYANSWTLLCFCDAASPELRRMREECSELAKTFKDLQYMLISSTAIEDDFAYTYLDVERYASDAYQRTKGIAVMLVRPDGYIGFSAREPAIPALRQYCARWLR